MLGFELKGRTCDAVYVIVFSLKSPFLPVHTKNNVKSSLLKPFLTVSVFIHVFYGFSVDDTQKTYQKVFARSTFPISVDGALVLYEGQSSLMEHHPYLLS